jgi:hypothetical protein
MPETLKKPEPPPKTEGVSVFGLGNGVWHLAFIGSYFGLCALTLKSCQGAALWQVFMLHSWWLFIAGMVARNANGLACELVDARAQRLHAEAMVLFLKAEAEEMARTRKVERWERSAPGAELEPVYAPPSRHVTGERPMLDKDLGVRVRP